MSKKVSGSKYQYQEVDRNGDLLPPYYRRNAMHPDGVSRVVTAKNYSHWKEKVAKLFEDYKKAQLGLVVNYPKLTYKEIGKEFLDYKKTSLNPHITRIGSTLQTRYFHSSAQ